LVLPYPFLHDTKGGFGNVAPELDAIALGTTLASTLV
jgi:hypothetical protein